MAVIVMDKLKKRTIELYYILLKNLYKGNYIKYDNILNNISYIEINNYLDNKEFIYQNLINL